MWSCTEMHSIRHFSLLCQNWLEILLYPRLEKLFLTLFLFFFILSLTASKRWQTHCFNSWLVLRNWWLPSETLWICIKTLIRSLFLKLPSKHLRWNCFRNQKQSSNRGHSVLLTYSFVFLQVREESKDHNSNPFLRKQCSQPAEPSLFRTVQQIPGVGETKALLLLQQFGTIHQLCNASVKELELVVGQTAAQQIHRFLCSWPAWVALFWKTKDFGLFVFYEWQNFVFSNHILW